MNIKKHLFKYFFVLALLLTVSGIVSANISFSKPLDGNTESFNLIMDNINSENIEVIGYDGTNISYLLEINSFIKEYTLSFDVYNDSNYDASLQDLIIDEIPDELKEIMIYDVSISESLDKNTKDTVTITYRVKRDLTNSEISTLNNYGSLKVNVLLNYTQE